MWKSTSFLTVNILLHVISSIAVKPSPESTDGETEIGKVLVEYLHQPDIAASVRALKGGWPFDATASCSPVSTRDFAYRDYIEQGRDDVTDRLWTVTSCGKNVFTRDDGRVTSRLQEQQQQGKQRHAGENAADSSMSAGEALKELEKEIDRMLWNFDRRQQLAQILKSRKQRSIDDDVSDGKSGRVVGGHVVQEGAWPWLAAVGLKSRGPKCGGSLIADQWVLTAAHCFKDFEAACMYNVRLGSRNWLYDNKETHVDVTIKAIYRHPDYDSKTMANDVALLKLSEPVSLQESGSINAVCLPHSSRSVEPGTVCLAAGWGKLEEGSKAQVLDSREVPVNVLTYDDTCGEYDNGTIRPGMVCVGLEKGGRDTCQGDSGGPLIYRADNRWIQLGITSFGEGCARPKHPGIYTDVGFHVNWIASVVHRYS